MENTEMSLRDIVIHQKVLKYVIDISEGEKMRVK